MQHFTRYVGLDVHARTIQVAVAEGGSRADPQDHGVIANHPAALTKLAGRLTDSGGALRFYYEAGPSGYGVYRHLRALGYGCTVVAPSLMPRCPGARVKTDRRDARQLARLARSGDLTAVWVPEANHEAIRDLMRYRDDVRLAQRKWRQKLNAFLLRQGRCYDAGKTRWTLRHARWLEQQKFEPPLHQVVFQEYINAQAEATRRLAEIEAYLWQVLADWELRPLVEAMCALRGIDRVTAMTVVSELGDVTRFDHPRELMAFVGLTPSEHSSGERRRRGGITKAGNGYVRRVLTESAWSYRHPARQTRHMRRKCEPVDEVMASIAWKAQKRLCARYRRLARRGKPLNKINTAIARELLGFVWAVYQHIWPTLGLSIGSR